MKPGKNNKIEEILGSLDGIKPATAPAFFYTRLKAKMEAGLMQKESKPLLVRPVYILATIMVVLLMNALVVFNSGSTEGTEISEQETEQSIAAEYHINSNLTYEINQ
jgi:hypothetical protein